jgi:hypothetical protein
MESVLTHVPTILILKVTYVNDVLIIVILVSTQLCVQDVNRVTTINLQHKHAAQPVLFSSI